MSSITAKERDTSRIKMEAYYLDLFICSVYTYIINCANLAPAVSARCYVAYVIPMVLITETMHGED